MRKIFGTLLGLIAALLLALGGLPDASAQTETQWKAHDRNRPAPAVVDSGAPGAENSAGRAPSDAIVLFDGKDLSKWTQKDGSSAKWKVTAEYFEVVPKTKDIITKQPF